VKKSTIKGDETFMGVPQLKTKRCWKSCLHCASGVSLTSLDYVLKGPDKNNSQDPVKANKAATKIVTKGCDQVQRWQDRRMEPATETGCSNTQQPGQCNVGTCILSLQSVRRPDLPQRIGSELASLVEALLITRQDQDSEAQRGGGGCKSNISCKYDHPLAKARQVTLFAFHKERPLAAQLAVRVG
jgi:hypothetical protein